MRRSAQVVKPPFDTTAAERLINCVRSGPTLFARGERGEISWCISGLARSMLYTIAVSTGVSAEEARSLTPDAFDLCTDVPVLILPPTVAPGRRGLCLPLSGIATAMLGEFLMDGESSVPVFRIPTARTVDRIVAFDAKSAEVPGADSVTFADLAAVFTGSLHSKPGQTMVRQWNARSLELC